MVAMKSIENSRLMRFQSLNAYRKRFNMKPYTSFEDMTGKKETYLFIIIMVSTKLCKMQEIKVLT